MEYEHFAQHKLQPLEYHRQCISEGRRVDGRKFEDFRPISLQTSIISTANGSCLVRQGHTCVIAAVKAELGEPEPMKPQEGIIHFSLELNIPPESLNVAELSVPDTQLITHELQQLFECGQLLRLKDLCIEEGKWVWTLYCDLICVDYGGSLLDCCLLSVLTALSSASIPSVSVDLSTKKPLKLQSFPVATSFLLVDQQILLVDPSDEEEKLLSGGVKIICSADSIHSLRKSSGVSSNAQVDECYRRAKARQKSVKQMVDEVIKTSGKSSAN